MHHQVLMCGNPTLQRMLSQDSQPAMLRRELNYAGGKAAFMRLDGEPWMQDLTGTTSDQPLRVSVALAGSTALSSTCACVCVRALAPAYGHIFMPA